MPNEKTVKVTDRSMVYDPSVGKNVRSPHFAKGEKSITKETTIKKDGKLRKTVEASAWNVMDKGRFKESKELNVSKYNKAGELKKKVSITSEDGVVKKTVTRPNGKTVTKRAGFIAKARVNKL